MTSEASILERPNVFIFSEETEHAVPWNLTHVKVDPSIKEIDTGAFENCLSLVEVEFSEGLEIIFSHVFFNCGNLKHINKLPSTLKEIHAEAFAGCEALVEVEFSEGMQVIRKYALTVAVG
jgi:hypothetical protein